MERAADGDVLVPAVPGGVPDGPLETPLFFTILLSETVVRSVPAIPGLGIFGLPPPFTAVFSTDPVPGVPLTGVLLAVLEGWPVTATLSSE